MVARELTVQADKRYWAAEREAVIIFARHDGVELEFIVTKAAIEAVGDLSASLNEEPALLTFDNYEHVFLDAGMRVWRAAGDSKPAYFINEGDLVTG